MALFNAIVPLEIEPPLKYNTLPEGTFNVPFSRLKSSLIS